MEIARENLLKYEIKINISRGAKKLYKTEHLQIKKISRDKKKSWVCHQDKSKFFINPNTIIQKVENILINLKLKYKRMNNKRKE